MPEANTKDQTKAKSKTRSIRFKCQAPGATSVYLAGSFNGWDERATPMRRQKNGYWVAVKRLAPGHHEYKFIVDDQWVCEGGSRSADSESPRLIPNPFGTMNCVVEVK